MYTSFFFKNCKSESGGTFPYFKWSATATKRDEVIFLCSCSQWLLAHSKIGPFEVGQYNVRTAESRIRFGKALVSSRRVRVRKEITWAILEQENGSDLEDFSAVDIPAISTRENHREMNRFFPRGLPKLFLYGPLAPYSAALVAIIGAILI